MNSTFKSKAIGFLKSFTPYQIIYLLSVFLLTAAAEEEEQVPERAIAGLEGWVECFPRASLAGAVFAGGLNGEGEIAGHPALKKAYDMSAAIK